MIRRILRYLKRRRDILISFKANSMYMVPGNYVFDDTIQFIILDDGKTKEQASKMFRNHGGKNSRYKWIFYLIKLVMFRRIQLLSNNSDRLGFDGTVFLPVRSSLDYKDIKIFDLRNRKILSIFQNEKDFTATLNLYDWFSKHFSLPKILGSNRDQLFILEELVMFIPNITWREEDYESVINDVFDRYYQYYHDCKKNSFPTQTPSSILSSLPQDQNLKNISDLINPELLKVEIPCIKQHGDMWTANVLIAQNNEGIYYIDWEWSGDYIFYYDFFMMMWNEFIHNRNPIYMKDYIQGKYDGKLANIFILFDLEFVKANRMDYFNIFLINLYKEKRVYLDHHHKIYFFEQYEHLLCQIKFWSANGVETN